MSGIRDRASGIRSGFTLLEILVVIVIIGILASLILVSVTGALSTARQNSTEQLISQLRGALEQYRVRWGDYPPTTLAEFKARMPNDANNGAEALTACLSSQDRGGILWQAQDVQTYGNIDDDKAEKNLTNWFFGDNQLREILDNWGQPIVYMHHKDYRRATAPLITYRVRPSSQDVLIKPVQTPQTKTFANPDKFQLFSFGPDGAPGTADDVVGW